MSGKLIYLAAGGTGGHVFPAVAVAEMLAKDGWQIAFLTDRRGQQLLATAATGLAVHQISAASPLAGGMPRRLSALAKLAAGWVQSLLLMLGKRPAFVLGFGGYPSAPPLLAASWLGIPAGLHEQNARIGRANLFLARRCGHLLTSWPDSQPLPDKTRLDETGLPVRAAFFNQAEPAIAPDRLELLIIGGSLGAALFADLVPAAVALLEDGLRGRLSIVQQVRAEQADSLKKRWQELGQSVELASFFADLPERMGRADLIICRAGAASVAEVAAAGRAAIFVPFAAAMDDHQSANAASLVSDGAALSLPENEASPQKLAEMMTRLLGDSARRNNMARQAKARARPQACRAIVEIIEARLADSARRAA